MKRIIYRSFIVFILALELFSSNAFALAPNMYGWQWVGKPIYLQGTTKFTNASDISGSNIMYRLRDSYTYKSRRTYVTGSDWMQTKLFDNNNSYNYANITYDILPDGLGYGYTEWYDSPQGIFLDYVTQFITGNIQDTSHGSPNIIKDSISYNKIQYPGTQQIAFLGSTQAEGTLADAKSGAILNRIGKTNYPIYLNNNKDIDSEVLQELNNKNVRNLWILGGSARFNATAGLSSKFNVIRVGGIDRNETLEFMKNSPEKLKLPSRYDGDSNGIVIKGDLGWLNSSVYNKLLSAKNNRNVNDIITAATDIFNNMNVGSTPSSNQDPAIVIGVNVSGWESYVSIYYSQRSGAYVYQFILPGYFDVYKPINNWVDIVGADHVDGNNYWVKPGTNFNVYTESRMNSYPYDLYPNATEALMESTDNGYSLSRHGLHPWDNGLYRLGDYDNNFNVLWGEKAYNWQRNDSGTINNYISGSHIMSAKYDNRNYRVYSSGYYIGFNSWIGNTPYQNGKWIRTDGTAPTITFLADRAENVWTKDNINVTVTSEDGRSGVETTKFWTQKDDSGWIWKGENVGAINLNTTGIHDVIVESIDKVKNSTGYVSRRYLIDKVNPVGNVEIKNVTPTGFDIVVNNMSDAHSGLNKVTLCTWTTTWNGDGKWQEKSVSNSTSTTNFRVNTSDYNNKSGTYYFDLRVFDKAGNELLLSKSVDVPYPVTIQGIISPNPSPAGKLLDLQIRTTGNANKLYIEFPDEILNLATDEENLIVSMNIPIELTHNQTIRSRLPIDTPLTLDSKGTRLRQAYVIKIAAENQYGERASGVLYLDVQESITTDVKVRIRSTGYDKGE